MRLNSFRIKNYRGVRLAEMDSLADSAVVTLSGPNGSGKSAILEAIAWVWQPSSPSTEVIGPWGDDVQIEVEVRLTDEEWLAANNYAHALGWGDLEHRREFRTSFRLTRAGAYTRDAPQAWQALSSGAFRQANRFAHLDYLPAERVVPRGESATVDPQVLGDEMADQFRTRVLIGLQNRRQIVQLSGVKSFLATLDYLDLVAGREGHPQADDYARLTEPFAAAAGKRIERPRLDAAHGASIDVSLPSGVSHDVDELSSGEQEVLGLMYFIRRLNTRHGLLLVDEPELHLHPALQRSLFEALTDVAEHAQVWIATHSATLIGDVATSAILHCRPPSIEDANQLTRASENRARLTLLEDLGISPIDVLQNDLLVVVEGPEDGSMLQQVLGPELARAAIFVAGGAAGVERTSATLQSGEMILPWIAIRDRDYLTDDEVADLQEAHPQLFVWPRRSLESELIDPALVTRTIGRVTGEATDLQRVTNVIRALADEDRGEIIADLVQAELKRRHPLASEKLGDPLDRARYYFLASRDAHDARARDFDAVAQQTRQRLELSWERDWLRYANAKRVLGKLPVHTPLRSKRDLVRAIAATLRQEDAGSSLGVTYLRRRLAELSVKK